MFGYIRPLKEELKVRDLNEYKALYCGLCRTLGKDYGFFARHILSYDFIFLAMLFHDGADCKKEKCRCPANPAKKTLCAEPALVGTAAAYSVILSHWKLCDNIADERFMKSIPHRAARLLLSRAYKKAKQGHAQFDETARCCLKDLSEYEKAGEKSLDKVADKFALILSKAADAVDDSFKHRILSNLLYHTGRFIYIVDACDDIGSDNENGQYNAVSARFDIADGVLCTTEKKSLKTTLRHSINLQIAAFELLPPNTYTDVLKNIVYHGLPAVAEQVLAGSWKKPRRHESD